MKKGIIFLAIFLLALIIILVINEGWYHPVSKADYIKQHPGQSILPFPWEPGTSIRVLPFNYDIPAAPSNNLSVTACRGQVEAASFLLHAQKDLSGITITPPTLRDGLGHSIPSAAIDIRLVKVWYQAAANDVWLDHNEYILAPELLLKDDRLVSVDYVNKTNYLRVTLNGTDQYIDISSPDATVPRNAQIHDTPSLQPFSLKANENKQVWLTVHVPDTTPAGEYYGNITITTPAETPVLMNFSVSVEPFDLAPAPLEYSLYYRGMVSDTIPTAVGSEWKTPEQYAAELQDMKDHGVLYPTLYQEADSPEFPAALQLRTLSGLPTDHIYIANGIKATTYSSSTALNALMVRFQAEQATVRQYGFARIYVYGVDEGGDATLLAERPSMTAFRNNGAGTFVACYNDAVNVVGDLLDVPVVAGALNPALAAQWHSNGKRIFSYANPQVGIENPEIYRQNYGFALWNAGYDGAMDYAYQHQYGPSIWNDFDDVADHYRDHVFAYPTTNGVIDTVQWEGWREGVDDTRYVASLIKTDGNATSAKAIIGRSLSQGDNMTTIRNTVINQILASYTPTPTPAP